MHTSKNIVYDLLNGIVHSDITASAKLFKNGISNECCWHVSHPVNQCCGSDEIIDNYIAPLKQAFDSLHRRDFIVMGGTSVTGSGEWVALMGHYVGVFNAPLFGIPHHNRLAFLRYGEIYRIENNKICEARILIDLIDLMRQAGCMPLPEILGTEMQFPAPATQDGIMLKSQPVAQSDRSVKLVSDMLVDLRTFDPVTFDSAGQAGKDGYWHEQMLWYGPCGIGSSYTYGGFEKDHRIPFLTAFPDRVGGNHYARFGDGDYVCSGGWPSLTATHRGDYLGVAATGNKLGMRVMDFWRVNDNKIMENWVLIDIIDTFLQMDVDLLAAITDKD